MQSELWLRLLGLASPALFGALCGAAGLFARPSDAIATLNRYALTIGFPALVALGVARAELASAGSAGFWLLWPVAALIGLALIRRFGATSAAPLALVFVFGNVAYLGLPFTRAMLGDDAGVIAALLVAVHVSIAVSLGPYLLRAWSGRDTEGALRRVLKTPLVWAPLAGVALRALPPGPALRRTPRSIRSRRARRRSPSSSSGSTSTRSGAGSGGRAAARPCSSSCAASSRPCS